MLSFEDKQRNHALVSLVHGLGMRKRPRPLFLGSSIDPSAVAYTRIFYEEAYRLGAPFVMVEFSDPQLTRLKYLHAPESMRAHVPQYVGARVKELVDNETIFVRIDGNDNIGTYKDIDPKYPVAEVEAIYKVNEPLNKLRMSMKRRWHVCAAATAPWANALNMSVSQLWDHLFKFTGADRVDALEYMENNLLKLGRRAKMLTELGVRKLRFVGPDTDLIVGLSDHARWVGGSRKSDDGTSFAPNWPTYEVYSTPDWRSVEGAAAITMPASVNGTVVRGLSVVFERGRIVCATADEGESTYRKAIAVDAGAAQLGEVALVGMDSPIAQCGQLFLETLLDENARCHIATGRAFPVGIQGGPGMSKEQLEALGCNFSDTHRDVMISDKHTDVFATTKDGVLVQLLSKGNWTDGFA